MPHTTRRQVALQRARHTGETLTQARAGIGRGSSLHGLDHCTPTQRALRALIAMGVFNDGYRGAPPRGWGAHRLIVYGFHLSPRYDDLVIFTDSPDNVARCFASWRAKRPAFPGWRAVCVSAHVRLVHLPTGATLGVEAVDSDRRRSQCANPCPGSRHAKYMATDAPLTEEEDTELGAVPPMSANASMLLAGLFARMTLTAADGSWATGGWFSCPPEVSARRSFVPQTGRVLWGSHDRWSLSWGGFPDAEFVAAALTDPRVGLAGAAAHDDGRAIVVRYGTASLTLAEDFRVSPPISLSTTPA